MRTIARLLVVSSLALVPALTSGLPAQAACEEPHDIEVGWPPLAACANYPIVRVEY